ncbi:hypothetical protein AAL_08191 [Moelleriella libera RCEF 2490]|uniref:Alpha N-terminal protein methyltransferase 1 n=1 Tax=Moelleriella libera RCEF 2490 TaxID=1081109 RepID=A0A167VZ39_9HYPO|nr:hypothetical protein AAL_08191 [Moelleriella libera RCEF 2490]
MASLRMFVECRIDLVASSAANFSTLKPSPKMPTIDGHVLFAQRDNSTASAKTNAARTGAAQNTASLLQKDGSSINPETSRAFWQNTCADVNGMLGGVPALAGFGAISRTDIQGSRTFLARLGIGLKKGEKSIASAVDGGAGIGRITEGLLLHVAECVDVIEPIAKFTSGLGTKSGVRHIFNVGLEQWTPTEGAAYDLVWTQWCLGYLTDDEVVRYLQTCKTALRPDTGLIVVKENLSTGDQDLFHDSDSSVTRLAAVNLSIDRRTPTDKLLGQDFVAMGTAPVQCRTPMRVPDVHICAVFGKIADDGVLPRPRGEKHCSPSKDSQVGPDSCLF